MLLAYYANMYLSYLQRSRAPMKLGMIKVRVFGSGTRKNPKPEVRGRVGSGWTFFGSGFFGSGPRGGSKIRVGSGFENSGFLGTLVHTYEVHVTRYHM